ncbi:cAMP-dependent protein kinase inhibitor beta isoform X3 [Bubalus kerabau]|uniref:cAMP-dependent protein kinase inhibitor beta isoform X3 n=1 Tax=Bubalus carabanensis TaxID=3119969 RepID=UPI00244ED631|nr:cAMP-dependent protein kinase inhibitor beta isoform X3 [Bubalus carabanensis]
MTTRSTVILMFAPRHTWKKGLSEFLPTSVLEIAAYFNQIFLGASETTCQRWTKPASTIVPSSLQFSRSFVSVLGIVN